MSERYDYQQQLEERERRQIEEEQERERRRQWRAAWDKWAKQYDKEHSNAENQ